MSQDKIISRSVVVFCNPSPETPDVMPPVATDPDAAAVYLALAREDVRTAIAHLEATATTFAATVALDALHDALTAIEAEIGVFDADE